MATVMRARLLALIVVAIAVPLIAPISIRAQDANLPRLEKRGLTTQLIVDGKPFLDARRRAPQFQFVQPGIHEAALAATRRRPAQHALDAALLGTRRTG